MRYRHIEDSLHIACVKWFSLQYPKLARCLHHSPNGGKRNAREAARFKEMGTRPGFPDLFLMFPNKAYHGLFIELKSPKGTVQESQKEFKELSESLGYRYGLCRSIEQFQELVKSYFSQV